MKYRLKGFWLFTRGNVDDDIYKGYVSNYENMVLSS